MSRVPTSGFLVSSNKWFFLSLSYNSFTSIIGHQLLLIFFLFFFLFLEGLFQRPIIIHLTVSNLSAALFFPCLSDLYFSLHLSWCLINDFFHILDSLIDSQQVSCAFSFLCFISLSIHHLIGVWEIESLLSDFYFAFAIFIFHFWSRKRAPKKRRDYRSIECQFLINRILTASK